MYFPLNILYRRELNSKGHNGAVYFINRTINQMILVYQEKKIRNNAKQLPRKYKTIQ